MNGRSMRRVSKPPGVASLNLSTNPRLWLLPTLGVSRTGTSVTSWTDQSSNQYVLTPGNVSASATSPTVNTGIKGMTTLYFDGTAALATSTLISSSTTFTISVVQKMATVSSTSRRIVFLNGGSGGGGYALCANSSGIRTCLASGVGWTDFGTVTTSAECWTWCSNGKVYLNGTNISTGGTSFQTPSNKAFVGCNNAGAETFTGDIGEILFFSSLISDTDRQKVEAYLVQKWL